MSKMVKWQQIGVFLIVTLLCSFVVQGCVPKNTKEVISISQSGASMELMDKIANDKRQKKHIVLPNGLEALLIYDEKANKSSMALDIDVGSMNDPDNALGLSHYLEHMVLAGSKTYPNPDDFENFLKKYQGSRNAMTWGNHTNYYFSLNHEGLFGAMTQFSLFFVEPLFRADWSEKEKNAVHSEFEMNYLNDGRRSFSLRKALSRKDHPFRKFQTGNKDTLEKVTRDDLLRYYRENYSANRMRLFVHSKNSLYEMEKNVRDNFSAIKNYDYPPKNYAEDVVAKKDLPLWVEMQAIKDVKDMTLMFPGTDSTPYYRSKAYGLISHILGYEGAGSLVSYLKEENLIKSLSADYSGYGFNGGFAFGLELTEKGKANKNRIVESFFAYVNLLKSKPLDDYLFEERQAMAAVSYVYRDHIEGGSYASHMATQMHNYPPLEIEKNQSLIFEKSEKDFKKFMNYLRPDNMIVLYMDKDVKGKSTEKYYQVKYNKEKIASDLVGHWQKAKADQQKLFLPMKNPYVPKNVPVLKNLPESSPQKILDEAGLEFWFRKDDRFYLPKASLVIHLLTHKVNESAKNKTEAILYNLALNQTLNHYVYDLAMAGISLNIQRTGSGFKISASGYSEKLLSALRDFVGKLQTIHISEERFESIKKDFKEQILNSRLNRAYETSMYLQSYLMDPDFIVRDDIYDPENNIDVVSDISLDDVKNYALRAFQAIGLRGAAYGYLSQEEVQEVVGNIPRQLKAQLMKKEDWPVEDVVHLAAGKPRVYIKEGMTNNGAVTSLLQIGPRTPENAAKGELMHAVLSIDFGQQLRTVQQLGYIVHGFTRISEDSVSFVQLIQSDKYKMDEVYQRIQKWHVNAQKIVNDLKEEEFEKFKAGIIQELEHEDKTIDQALGTLYFEAITKKQSFDYPKKVIAYLEKLKLSEFQKFIEEVFDKNKRREINVFVLEKGDLKKDLKLGSLENIDDPEKFKSESKKLENIHSVK